MKKITTLILLMLMATPALGMNNQLSSEEKSQGWELLFNGEDMSQWRNFKKPGVNSKWVVKDGTMQLTEKGGGDILTKKAYENFELKLEWKVSQAGNSGIFILADEKGPHIYTNAPEVQILDNERHIDNKISSHLSGSLFDLVASPKSSHKPAGEWNQVRILLNDSHLKVWQNQVQTIDIKIGGKEWNRLVAKSKFATWKGFGVNRTGHIGLQDHNDPVAFRNIKVKEL